MRGGLIYALALKKKLVHISIWRSQTGRDSIHGRLIVLPFFVLFFFRKTKKRRSRFSLKKKASINLGLASSARALASLARLLVGSLRELIVFVFYFFISLPFFLCLLKQAKEKV